MGQPAAPSVTTRFNELDSLRGLAALGVVLWHYSGMFGAQPLSGPLRPLYLSGGLLVDFFFVLSGFVLSRSFDRPGKQDHFGRNVWQRVARMYPLHFVTLLAVVACDAVNAMHGHAPRADNDGYHFVLNLLLLQSSGLQHDYSFNGPSWSISAEFLINLVFLGVIAYAGKLGRWLMAASAVACGLVLLQHGILDNGAPISGKLGGVLDLTLVRCWFGFFIGTQCYRFYQARPRRSERLFGAAAWTGDVVGGLALLMILAYMERALPQSHLGDVLLAAVGFPALLLGAVYSGRLRACLRWRPLTFLGEISYSIYLVHFPLIVLAVIFGGLIMPIPMDSTWSLAGFYALVVATAALSYRYVELPGKRWMASWLPSPQQVANRAVPLTPGYWPRSVRGSRDEAYRRLAR